MTSTLILLCAASTRSSRTGGFPSPLEPLDEPGRRDAGRCAIEPRFHEHAVRSPAIAARETAAAMGLRCEAHPALADIDHGGWAGRGFADVHADAPDDITRWLADPAVGAPDGETMASVQARVGRWLDTCAGNGTVCCAITHPAVIRAALAHALDLPPAATMRIDVAPLSRTLLSFNRIWRLQGIVPPA